MQMTNVLVIDTDPIVGRTINDSLASEGARVLTIGDADVAMQLLKQEPIDALFVSAKVSGRDGLLVIQEARRCRPGVAVVLMTGFPTVDSVVHALHAGVCDYLVKPLMAKEISQAFSRVTAALRSRGQANGRCGSGTNADAQACKIVAVSETMREVATQAARIARSDMHVLIQGEAGVGKQLVARAIHRVSQRGAGPFVLATIAAMRQDQIEATLFGQEQGEHVQPGLLEQARGGCLYLQHICETPLWIQDKLAVALQQGWFTRCEGQERVPVETRVIAGCAIELKRAIADGVVRRTLYYQLNATPIVIPAMRQRKEDIPPLAAHFLAQITRGMPNASGARPTRFSKEALELLSKYDWPGNVLELANVVRQAAVAARGDEIAAGELPNLAAHQDGGEQNANSIKVPLAGDLKSIERYIIAEVIKTCNGNKAAAARMLGLHRRTLYRMLESAGRRNGVLNAS